jgi:deoxyribonuclease IV
MKLLIGSHVSYNKDKQLLGSVEEALSYGANTFMFYTGAPQNTNRVMIDDSLTYQGLELMKLNNIDYSNVVVHAPYIINLANNTSADAYNFAISFLNDEINRCERLCITKLVLHPGSHVGLGRDKGISNIIKALNRVLTPDQGVKICLEYMSGKGSECGNDFLDLKEIIEGVIYPEKLLVCLDTCHLSDSGYDLSDFNNILDKFDELIGINRLGVIHVNDSKNIVGSKKDRHENIGIGNIGFDNILNIIYNPKLEGIPFILETPYVTDISNENEKLYPPYKFEIEMIKNKIFNENLINDIRDYYKKTK